MAFKVREIFQALAEAAIDYVVVGGMALRQIAAETGLQVR